MSYVLAADIGCSQPENPYSYLEDGVDTMFLHPQTIATSGKTGNTSPGSTTEVIMGFFADQVRIGGWRKHNSEFYHSLYSQSYPNSWIPYHYSNSAHVTINGTMSHYNLGQLYLINSMAWTFLKWPKDSVTYELINVNDPGSRAAPVFANKYALPLGLVNAEEFINPTPKYGTMIKLALQQAYAYPDIKGPCGGIMTFICNVLDRKHHEWYLKNNSMTAKWWRIVRQN